MVHMDGQLKSMTMSMGTHPITAEIVVPGTRYTWAPHVGLVPFTFPWKVVQSRRRENLIVSTQPTGYQRASKQEEITPPKEEQRTDELSQSVSTWIRLKYDWTGCIESNGSDFDQREVLGYHKDSRSWHPCQRLINLKRKKTSKKVYPTYTGLRAIVFKS